MTPFRLTGLILIATGLAGTAQGKSSTDAGFAKLQANVDNSQTNLDSYRKNLVVVEGNLSEIGKARGAVENQKRQVASEIADNRENLKRLEKNDKELSGLITDEKNKLAAEEKKMKDLEAMIAQIQANRRQREANIAAYQQQQTALAEEKKTWQIRGEGLKTQEIKTQARAKEMSAMESEWKNKRRGYEAEISRWQKELDKQSRNLQQFQALAESKK